jgi:hypothetical protein
MNIPTTDEAFGRRCKGVSQDVNEALVNRLMPIVTPLTDAQGTEDMRERLAESEKRVEVLSKYASTAKCTIKNCKEHGKGDMSEEHRDQDPTGPGVDEPEQEPTSTPQSNEDQSRATFAPTPIRRRGGGTRSSRLRFAARRSRSRRLRFNRDTN